MISPIVEDIAGLITPERIQIAARIILVIVLGLVLIKILQIVAGRLGRRRLSPQTAMILRKAIFYTGAVLILINVFQQLGFKLTALLGAAGIAGIAIGFASQTSISNLISGLFLISEKPFAVGDVIKVGERVGIVQSIDLLSVKIRTFDNLYVRIPNESLIKSELINITYFPIRRMDLTINVAYKEDIRKVRDVLFEIAAKNPYCLDEPEPLFLFTNFGESSLELLLGIWFQKTDYLNLKNSIMVEIKERFEAEGIEIPFPHRTVYTGSITEPYPVRIVEEKKESKRRSRTK